LPNHRPGWRLDFVQGVAIRANHARQRGLHVHAVGVDGRGVAAQRGVRRRRQPDGEQHRHSGPHECQNSRVQVMRHFLLAAALLLQARPDLADHRVFVIDNFKTEGGVTLPTARIVYGTYGKLNAARDNAILLPSHYMANHHGYDWLIGGDRALDPDKLFLVATEMFGNGQSSSPSNTPEPFHGPRFPITTIRDNVEAVHRLLTDELKITHVRAIIGFSMGAEQAFQWAVSYPGFADRIVATSGTAR